MKTFCITLPETPARKQRASDHFKTIGLDVEFVNGIHGLSFGLMTTHTYDHDAPGEGRRVSAKHVGMCLSHYMVWTMCNSLPDQHFLILEDDALFEPDWLKFWNRALNDVPADFDMLLLGSCNCSDKPMTRIAGEIYDVRYPMCCHAYIVAKKALPVLLETQRRIFAPIDIALMFRTYEKIKVLTVLPRIVNQFEQVISP